ncbi:MAG: S1C family serine protease [Clostridia bacterium]|nr:S1C family serine protease [Clostridia bacterium]
MDEQEKFEVSENQEQASTEPVEAEEVKAAEAESQPQQEPAPQQTAQQSGYSTSGEFYSRPQSTSYYDASKESGYSPYSNQQRYNYTANQNPYANTTAAEEKAKKSNGKKLGKIILCLAIAAIVMFCGIVGSFIAFKSKKSENHSSNKGDAELLISESNLTPVDDSDGLSAQEIYSQNIKSNVGIILYGTVNNLFSQGNSGSSNVAGEGSGIIMGESKDKKKTYVITCAHVIEAAKTKGYKVVIQDYNGEQFDAEVVGFDSKTDLGVLAVKETGFTAAKFGDSSKLKIGETVYAIGNPGGTEFFGSYTKGMVSAIDRPVSNEIGYDMKCIQHDAAINPGNSGGMLINTAGQIIGINSSKIASTEYEGMGFAIPISSAKTIIDDIIANGYVTNRPKLGITYSPVSQYSSYAMIAHYNNLPAGSLIIAQIGEESAFKGTDAQAGDLIIAVDGVEMETADTLLDKIENGKVGDKLKLTLCRVDEKTYDVKKFDVVVTLIEDKGTAITTTQQQQQPFGGGANGGSLEDFFKFFDNGSGF